MKLATIRNVCWIIEFEVKCGNMKLLKKCHAIGCVCSFYLLMMMKKRAEEPIAKSCGFWCKQRTINNLNDLPGGMTLPNGAVTGYCIVSAQTSVINPIVLSRTIAEHTRSNTFHASAGAARSFDDDDDEDARSLLWPLRVAAK